MLKNIVKKILHTFLVVSILLPNLLFAIPIAEAADTFSLTIHVEDKNGQKIDDKLSNLEDTEIYLGIGWESANNAGDTIYKVDNKNTHKNLAKINTSGATISLAQHPYDIWATGSTYYGEFVTKICKVCGARCDDRVLTVDKCNPNKNIDDWSTFADNSYIVGVDYTPFISYKSSGISYDYVYYEDFKDDFNKKTTVIKNKYSSGEITLPTLNLYRPNEAFEGSIRVDVQPKDVIKQNDETYKKIFENIKTNTFSIKLSSDHDGDKKNGYEKTLKTKQYEISSYHIDTSYDPDMPSVSTETIGYEDLIYQHNFFNTSDQGFQSLDLKVEVINSENVVVATKFSTLERSKPTTNISINLTESSTFAKNTVQTSTITFTTVENTNPEIHVRSEIKATLKENNKEISIKNFHISQGQKQNNTDISTGQTLELCVLSAQGNLKAELPDTEKKYKLPIPCKTFDFDKDLTTNNSGKTSVVTSVKYQFELLDESSEEEYDEDAGTTENTTTQEDVNIEEQEHTYSSETPDTTSAGKFEWFKSDFGEPIEVTAQAPFFGKEGEVKYSSLGEYLTAFYVFAVWLIAAIAVIMIIYGGYMIITSNGNPEGIAQARGIIMSALISLALLLLAFVLLRIISPQTLKSTLPEAGQGLQEAGEKATQNTQKLIDESVASKEEGSGEGGEIGGSVGDGATWGGTGGIDTVYNSDPVEGSIPEDFSGFEDTGLSISMPF